jgi:antitoxin (DNA-binding transcriptional repressor) of toxin-antitoxin stability system
MKTATVANLCNNFRAISAWIDHGETVQITKRGHAYARLMPVTAPAHVAPTAAVPAPEPPPPAAETVWPDFAARQKAIFGNHVYTEEEVRRMRDYEAETYEQELLCTSPTHP